MTKNMATITIPSPIDSYSAFPDLLSSDIGGDLGKLCDIYENQMLLKKEVKREIWMFLSGSRSHVHLNCSDELIKNHQTMYLIVNPRREPLTTTYSSFCRKKRKEAIDKWGNDVEICEMLKRRIFTW